MTSDESAEPTVLLRKDVLDGIVAGRIDLVYRRWRKPTVRTGGRLRTRAGELDIVAVEVTDPSTIGDGDARRAGFVSAAALVDDLFRERPASARGARPTDDSVVYRVQVRFGGADTRAAVRDDDRLTDEELATLVTKLTRMDARSSSGPWTTRVLRLIADNPGRRAPDLAAGEGRETLPFKADVRKLKELGLTESLTVGYRISPRGAVVLQAAEARGSNADR